MTAESARTASVGGVRLPYPFPASVSTTAVMLGNRKRDTRPEVALRSALHRAGVRFRKNFPIRVGGARPVRVDIAFPRTRVAVFVDGCFWHSCPAHGTQPRSNPEYWERKLTRNVERDRSVDDRLRADGWRVIRVWEHEAPAAARDRVLDALRPASAS